MEDTSYNLCLWFNFITVFICRGECIYVRNTYKATERGVYWLTRLLPLIIFLFVLSGHILYMVPNIAVLFYVHEVDVLLYRLEELLCVPLKGLSCFCISLLYMSSCKHRCNSISGRYYDKRIAGIAIVIIPISDN